MIRHTVKRAFDYHNWYAPSVYMVIVGIIGGGLIPHDAWVHVIVQFAWIVVSSLAGVLIVAGLRRLEKRRQRVR